MNPLVLNHAEVRRLLPMDVCIERMAKALRTLARGNAVNPLRWGMPLPEALGIFGMMPGMTTGDEEMPAALGIKLVSIFPRNEGTAYDSHQGVIVLFDPERGYPTAVVDAAEVTAIRTAAVSGLATRLLAREDARELAILGSGVQARTHLEAVRAVRRIERVRVWSPTREHREAFAERERERHGLPVEAAGTAREAVAGADVVCTATSAKTPVVEGPWLAEGCHVNAVGSSTPRARELYTAAVVRSRLFVDRRESAFREAGDVLLPLEEGAIGEAHVVAELGEVLLGRAEGRCRPGELTLFKSLGLAVEDLAAAQHVVERARAEGLGSEVEIGRLPDAGD